MKDYTNCTTFSLLTIKHRLGHKYADTDSNLRNDIIQCIVYVGVYITTLRHT